MSDDKGNPAPVLVSFPVVKRHFDAAIPEAQRLLAAAPGTGIKPYETALAWAVALKAICKDYGWTPDHFFQLIQTVEDLRKVGGS